MGVLFSICILWGTINFLFNVILSVKHYITLGYYQISDNERTLPHRREGYLKGLWDGISLRSRRRRRSRRRWELLSSRSAIPVRRIAR